MEAAAAVASVAVMDVAAAMAATMMAEAEVAAAAEIEVGRRLWWP